MLRNERHERLIWGAGQGGISARMTRALVQGPLPSRAAENGLAIVLICVDWNANAAEWVYANNKAAANTAVQRAVIPNRPSR